VCCEFIRDRSITRVVKGFCGRLPPSIGKRRGAFTKRKGNNEGKSGLSGGPYPTDDAGSAMVKMWEGFIVANLEAVRE